MPLSNPARPNPYASCPYKYYPISGCYASVTSSLFIIPYIEKIANNATGNLRKALLGEMLSNVASDKGLRGGIYPLRHFLMKMPLLPRGEAFEL